MFVSTPVNPHSGVMRRVRARLQQSGLVPVLASSRSERWASITFTGARHHYRFRCVPPPSPDLFARLSAELSDMEFTIPGHLVADLAVELEGNDVVVEALTVEDV